MQDQLGNLGKVNARQEELLFARGDETSSLECPLPNLIGAFPPETTLIPYGHWSLSIKGVLRGCCFL